MNNLHNHMDQIKLSGIRVIGERAATLAAQGRRVVKLQVGEPDFSTPRHVIDASIASLEECDTHYAPNRGIFSLREAVSEKLKKDNGIACFCEKTAAETGVYVDPGHTLMNRFVQKD